MRQIIFGLAMGMLALACSEDQQQGVAGSGAGASRDGSVSMDVFAVPSADSDVETNAMQDAAAAVDAQNRPDGMSCGTVTARALGANRPVDIVWAIDSSPSMGDEIETIERNLNEFAMRIGSSQLDYRVVLIGSERELVGTVDIPEPHNHHAICVPPPLSAQDACPDVDSETYLHVRSPIHSADALDVLMETYAEQWRGFLREEARLHVIAVSDDDHGRSVDRDMLLALGLPADFYFHSIVNPIDTVDGCAAFGEDDGVECGCGGDGGAVYMNLSAVTDGLMLNLCQDDWSPIFEQLNERVASGSAIPCQFNMPEPRGAVIDFERVNVDFVNAMGTRTALFNTDNCENDPTGWRYDNPEMPRRIVLCPSVCGDLDGEVEVEFGCESRKR